MRTLLSSLSLVLLAGCGGGGKHSNPSSSNSSVTFAANSIVYGVANGTNADYAVNQIPPIGGTPKTVVADVDGAILAFALDPSQTSCYALAADPSGTGTYGIYLSKNLALASATTLVAPTYVAVGSLAVTSDGTRVVYTGVTEDGISHLFVVPTAGGTPTPYGTADAAAIGPDGDLAAYTDLDRSNPSTGGEALYVRRLSNGSSVSPRQVAVGGNGLVLPTFSPDGKRVAYWTLESTGNGLRIADSNPNLLGGGSIAVPGVDAFEPQGLAFGPDGTTLALVGQSGSDGVIATAPADGSAAPTTIASSSALLGNYGFFWTDANGRATAGGRSGLGVSRARFRRKASIFR